MQQEKTGHFGREYGFGTRSIHAGNEIDSESGAIRRPIIMVNSYALPYDPTDMNWSSSEDTIYTRNGGANQKYLQEKIAALEETEDCVVLASGVAALSGMFFTFLKSGDHVVCANVTYIAVYRLLKQYLPEKYGIETTFVDASDLEAVRNAVRPNTRLIHIETPSNPIIGICDIAAIADIAHNAGALFSVDNTFASPYNQRPSALGADFTVESLTKYINGHGDAMGGSVAASKERIDRIRNEAMINLGGTISPFNAWLVMRGASTLPLRMQQHNENAMELAQFLKDDPHVRFVSYPGLTEHPGHSIAKKQMAGGFSGMLSFGLHTDTAGHNRFVSRLKIITSAVSLGHDESLITFLGPNDERQYLYPDVFKQGFFRFSVGLEDAVDLKRDIFEAF